jgi:hypothetical protein
MLFRSVTTPFSIGKKTGPLALLLILGCLLLSTSKTQVSAASPTLRQQQNSIASVTTRQTRFAIPFQVRTAADKAAAIEIQLHVSQDHGATWTLFTRQHPTAGSFQFQAKADGQYWFAVRTLARDGSIFPVETLRPELAVNVDTLPPKLDLVATLGTAGEVQTTWEVSDSQLAPKSLKLEYQPGPGTTWQPIAIDRPAPFLNRPSQTGQAKWWPETNATQISVRAEVKDVAGNTTVVLRRLKLAHTAKRQGRPSSQYKIDHRTDGAIAWRPMTPSVRSSQDDVRKRRMMIPAVADPATNLLDANDSRGTKPRDVPTWTANHGAANRPTGADANQSSRPAQNTPHLSGHRRFSLNYDLVSVGPSGIHTINVWCTQDSGQSWRHWTQDADRQSPVIIEVDQEGIYGFRIVAENNEGLSVPLPQPGEVADVQVAVDLTPPEVRLNSARYGRGANAGRLDIRWKATDNHLSEKPVTLKYRGGPDAGWQTIARHLPNTGQYDWRVDRHIPQQIYLKIEVSDGVGHVATDQLEQPISTRGLIPRVRVRSVNPLPENAPSARLPRILR